MDIRDCLTCGGRGFYRGYDDGNQIVEKSCDCVTQFKLHRQLLNAGISLQYQRLGWMDCHAVEDGAMTVVMDYFQHAEGYVRAGIGLLLHGEKGTGKTLLVSLLLKRLLSDGYDVQMITFQELIDVYTQSWRDPEEKLWFDKRVRNAGVLGIDDIGREHKGRMEIVESMFDHIIRARIAAARPTLITTNQSRDKFLTFYQSNIMSLLDEGSIKYCFTGDDYRPSLLERRTNEARAGISRPIVLG
jgi:DNA replication protein DnaC